MKARTVVFGGVAAAAIGFALRRRRLAARSRQPVTHVATVVKSPQEVRAAWTENGRLPGLPALVSPSDTIDVAPQRVPGVDGLSLQVALTPAPKDRGTEIRVAARGPRARAMKGRLRADMRDIKSVLECGEAVTVVGQTSGRGPWNQKIQEKVNVVLREGGRG